MADNVFIIENCSEGVRFVMKSRPFDSRNPPFQSPRRGLVREFALFDQLGPPINRDAPEAVDASAPTLFNLSPLSPRAPLGGSFARFCVQLDASFHLEESLCWLCWSFCRFGMYQQGMIYHTGIFVFFTLFHFVLYFISYCISFYLILYFISFYISFYSILYFVTIHFIFHFIPFYIFISFHFIF